jgi:hypothetical protein
MRIDPHCDVHALAQRSGVAIRSIVHSERRKSPAQIGRHDPAVSHSFQAVEASPNHRETPLPPMKAEAQIETAHDRKARGRKCC